MKIWMKDPVTGQESVTLTMFTVGFIVAVTKLALSDVLILGFHVESFTGADFAAVAAALGAIYVLRRNVSIGKEPQ